jgi:hypothetical protein
MLSCKATIASSSCATLESKTDFEAMYRDADVVLITYMTDSGLTFTSSKAFAKNSNQFCQNNKLAGTAAHKHNAMAERAIGVISFSDQSVLIHAAIHWPKVADTALWSDYDCCTCGVLVES